MKKVLVRFRDAEKHKTKIESICKDRWEVVYIPEQIGEDEFRSLLPGAEILIADVNPEWLTDAPDLKWVQISWAGVKPYIDMPVMEKVILTNASGAFGATIAEHAIGMLLALARNFRQYFENMKTGTWMDAGSEWQVEDKRVLILGTGDLGSQIAYRMGRFHDCVVGFCRTKKNMGKLFNKQITIEELDSELAQADAVFGALPETEDTIGLLDERRLQLMKDDAIIINCGRGSLIDTDALVRELGKGRFYGVGLDVTAPEPLPAGHPLWQCGRVLITPHVSGIGFGHLEKTAGRIWDIALENLSRYKAGLPLINVVDNERGY